MDKESISHHISKQFNAELEDIRNRVLSMGGLVEQQLILAIKAMVESDKEAAEKVVESDYKVNAMEVEIDEESVQVIARRQPTASDLRLVIAVIKTITDLERIGDESERIGRMALDVMNNPSLQLPITAWDNMGQRVRRMLHDALDAFARMDAEAAMRVWNEDSNVDGEYEGIMRQLMTYMMEDTRAIPKILEVIWATRALERIGDRVSNICEYIIYLVKGKDVRHISVEQMENTVHGS
ncbi:MAG: phosphate signaling complex protein PhoU [Gammaproteobacteria bacterium]|nr:phosphate signaling complex protein PhoU [Gammaproteobacteria bacterium]